MIEHQLNALGSSGVFSITASLLPAIKIASSRSNAQLLTVDISSKATGSEVLRQLGTSLHFPSWYGANFDALHDCLIDPDWQAGKEIFVLISGLAKLQSRNPSHFATLIEVFLAAAETRRKLNLPLWILLDIEAPGVSRLPCA